MAKYRYVPFKMVSLMTVDECNTLPPRSNWMPEVKLGTSSILPDDNPPVILSQFYSGLVHTVKMYGQYGCYDMTCKVLNYGLWGNKFVFPYQKLSGQHLHIIQKACCRTGLSHT